MASDTPASANRPLVVGLTGGIGAGKSTAARLFQQLGVPVLDTDDVARDVVAPHSDGLAAVRERFGDAVVNASGALDRTRLGQHVFADDDARRDLEAITHPRIRARVLDWIVRQTAPYCVVVVPLLFETGFDALVDRVAAISLDAQTQFTRVVTRDHRDADQVRLILRAQLPDATRRARADDVLRNDGSRHALTTQIIALDRRYRAMVTT